MRNSKKTLVTFVGFLAVIFFVLPPTSALAVDFTEPFVSDPPIINTPTTNTPTAETPSQRDQTPNSSVTRAFLKGAGYTAPSSDMTCSTNAQGVEVCVPSNDVRAYVVAIIKFVLSVVGFLFFALLFYAGYLWTTAGGNDEAVKKAQGIATKAVIGLSLILAAWAITTFITSFLQKSVAL